MPVRVIGNLTITDAGAVTFKGFTSDGIKVNGDGSVNPFPSSPGVNYNGSILTYDSDTIDGLDGKHALISPGSYAGKDDATLSYADGIKIIASCSLDKRTLFKAGEDSFIEIRVNSD